jgi:hypothetical protein
MFIVQLCMFIRYMPRNPFVLTNNYLNKEERIILNVLLSSNVNRSKRFLNVIPDSSRKPVQKAHDILECFEPRKV